MSNNFLINSEIAAPLNAEHQQCSGHSRRSFIKRTGAATVATIVAWNLTKTQARASEDPPNTYASATEHNWQIRFKGLTAPDFSASAEPVDFVYAGQLYEIRRCLYVSVSAPPNPADSPNPAGGHSPEYAPSAIATVTAKAVESAQIKPKEAKDEEGNWSKVSLDQWNQFTNNEHQDSYGPSATRTKTIDDASADTPTTSSTNSPNGTTLQGTSGNGISIRFLWEDDKLTVQVEMLAHGIGPASMQYETGWSFKDKANE